jgi:hypothetical protein
LSRTIGKNARVRSKVRLLQRGGGFLKTNSWLKKIDGYIKHLNSLFSRGGGSHGAGR